MEFPTTRFPPPDPSLPSPPSACAVVCADPRVVVAGLRRTSDPAFESWIRTNLPKGTSCVPT